jgi:hypothetical protein
MLINVNSWRCIWGLRRGGGGHPIFVSLYDIDDTLVCRKEQWISCDVGSSGFLNKVNVEIHKCSPRNRLINGLPVLIWQRINNVWITFKNFLQMRTNVTRKYIQLLSAHVTLIITYHFQYRKREKQLKPGRNKLIRNAFYISIKVPKMLVKNSIIPTQGVPRKTCHTSEERSFGLIYIDISWFDGLEVACWTLVPKSAGSHSAEAVGFLGRKNLSTPSFVGDVKPSVPCRSFTACKRSLNVTWKSAFRSNLPDICCPQFHLPSMGALAWWHAWRRLVAKVRTSNPDRTIGLKGYSA